MPTVPNKQFDAFDPDEFAQMYEAGREQAIETLVRMDFSRAIAEDAVQAAAEYNLRRQRKRITLAVFINHARLRAHHILEATYGSDRLDKRGRLKGKRKLVSYVGTSNDLERILYDSPGVYSEEEQG